MSELEDLDLVRVNFRDGSERIYFADHVGISLDVPPAVIRGEHSGALFDHRATEMPSGIPVYYERRQAPGEAA